jgi:hypothetical protein
LSGRQSAKRRSIGAAGGHQLKPIGSPNDWKSTLSGQPIQLGLHHGAHVGIDFIDVRLATESRFDVDGGQYLRDQFGREREIDPTQAQAKGKPQ